MKEETQMQRIIRKTESGEIGKGLFRISFNGFSASQFFETTEQLKEILKNTDAEKTIKMLSNVELKTN